jgi:ElaB/YqjD/DUF883 family membrane-anchored ribosome-binding protein
MSTKSQAVGKAVLHGIEMLEERAHDTVHSGASSARQLTKAGSRWAGRQERAASSKVNQLKRDVTRQVKQLRKTSSELATLASGQAEQAVISGSDYIKRKPWQALAIASSAALVIGALLGRRRS